jgi:diguanylate cyclase (GGDEF)-like protein
MIIKRIWNVVKMPDTLRSKIVLSFFSVFAFFFFLLLIGLYFLFNANTVAMDQILAVSEMRIVRMFMDFKYPQRWSVKEGKLFKGDVSVSDNALLDLSIVRFLRPGSRVSFHVGSVPENVEKLSFHGVNPVMELVMMLNKRDSRLEKLIQAHEKFNRPDLKEGFHIPRYPYPPPGFPPHSGMEPLGKRPMPPQIYILAGGIIDVIQSEEGKNLGWIRLEWESFGHGLLEKWIFAIIVVINILIFASVLFLAYRIMFKLSEPINCLEKKHKEIIVVNESLDDISQRDPLTGLLNRRGFELALDSFVFPSDKKTAAIAIIDLDNFKKINDTFGHACGDYVLKEASRIMAERIRQGDIACRWGGEEFVIFYSGVDNGNLTETAERIRYFISAYSYTFNNVKIAVTVTIGVSPCQTSSDFTDSLRRADTALYRGKREGKNRVVPC